MFCCGGDNLGGQLVDHFAGWCTTGGLPVCKMVLSEVCTRDKEIGSSRYVYYVAGNTHLYRYQTLTSEMTI